MALQFKVPSMTCEGCAEVVTKAIQSLDANAQVDIDVKTKAVSADTTASAEAVREAIAAKGHTMA
ncbi:MAG: heavy-metal-associated domain-containing protein [Leptolyngbyaceae cyanobacterium]